ncbi:hypothetical protein [Tuwongella immobilis]|uniref:Uncharacterized protein n=1 Tax=Tuwongella immobilis TaxID=692036 RepID=A0A6C2YQ75_9BACT|nr:hypothetical protein [Tuwongella immobilis]VIP03626.1 unnamed protein product [Tuwongella immobilis]VTS04620.1 unnamed protein product [Tuwongella immobilis]
MNISRKSILTKLILVIFLYLATWLLTWLIFCRSVEDRLITGHRENQDSEHTAIKFEEKFRDRTRETVSIEEILATDQYIVFGDTWTPFPLIVNVYCIYKTGRQAGGGELLILWTPVGNVILDKKLNWRKEWYQ